MEVVDEKCKRCGVSARKAALDLCLASDLNRRDESYQQGDQPDGESAA